MNTAVLEFTEVGTLSKIMIPVDKILAISENISECTTEHATDIFISGNRFIVNEAYESVKNRIVELMYR